MYTKCDWSKLSKSTPYMPKKRGLPFHSPLCQTAVVKSVHAIESAASHEQHGRPLRRSARLSSCVASFFPSLPNSSYVMTLRERIWRTTNQMVQTRKAVGMASSTSSASVKYDMEQPEVRIVTKQLWQTPWYATTISVSSHAGKARATGAPRHGLPLRSVCLFISHSASRCSSTRP